MKPAVLWVSAFLSIFAWMGVAAITVFFWSVIGVLYLFRSVVDPKLDLAHRLACCWGRLLVAISPGAGVRVTGKEHLPQNGPVVLMANHQSYTDVPVLCSIPYSFKWMADEELFRIPVFGWSMRMAGYIPVRRGDRRMTRVSLERAKGWISQGVSIFVFPEGTRSHTGIFGRFHTGGFYLAAETKTRIVPVVVIGTRQLLPRGSWIFRAGVTPEIRILPPLEPPGPTLKEIRQFAQKLRNQMNEVYFEEFKRKFDGKS